jgi:SAM-dependent methyltransferase
VAHPGDRDPRVAHFDTLVYLPCFGAPRSLSFYMPSSSPRDQDRWQQAQAYEAAWWEAFAPSFGTHYLEAYAADIERAVAGIACLGPDKSVVEVGAGPVGIAAFLSCGKRIATDPLHEAFEGNDRYSEQRAEARARGVIYISAQGEDLPFEDREFDLYISDNVLDHVEAPKTVLAEAFRVLRPGGVLYLRVHVYHAWGRALRWLMERVRLDRGHPYTFSSRAVKSLAIGAGFEVIRSDTSAFIEGWKGDWARARRGSAKALVQSVMGITRADHEVILRRPNEGSGRAEAS